MAANKYSDLPTEALVAKLLELETEIAALRPPPPKFRVGQVVFATQNAVADGAAPRYFEILAHRVFNNSNQYAWKAARGGLLPQYSWAPEDRLRALTQTEFDGTPMPAEAAPEPAMAQAGVINAVNDVMNHALREGGAGRNFRFAAADEVAPAAQPAAPARPAMRIRRFPVEEQF